MSAKTTTAQKLAQVRAELRDLWVVFESAGGRGIETAERIDYLSRRADRLAAQVLWESQSGTFGRPASKDELCLIETV